MDRCDRTARHGESCLQELRVALRTAMAQLPLDRDILSLTEVSAILRCSEDTLRRVPRDELPVYRVGKANLYLREEVIRYVRVHKMIRPFAGLPNDLSDDLAASIDGLIRDVIDSGTVDVREPSERTAT